MLRHWTFLYVAILLTGMLVVVAISFWWIHHTTLNHRTERMQQLAGDLAGKIVDASGRYVLDGRELPAWIDRRLGLLEIPEPLYVELKDSSGQVLFTKLGPRVEFGPDTAQAPASDTTASPSPGRRPPGGGSGNGNAPSSQQPSRGDRPLDDGWAGTEADGGAPSSSERSVVAEEQERAVDPARSRTHSVVLPLAHQGVELGTVTLRAPKPSIAEFGEEYLSLSQLLLAAALLGWLAIYLLARKLTRPIVEVAAAAKQIEQGSFDVELPAPVKEQELHDLLHSFGNMAGRLKQLEELRNELLAGVTHELKTPVTSIHGLLHAVRDQVVTGAEAEEFIEISLKETARLQHMVAELLDFNSFASGKVHVLADKLELGGLLNEIAYQWRLVREQEKPDFDLQLALPPQKLYAAGDPGRIQQILINLLQNARQALGKQGRITVELQEHSDSQLVVYVSDNGCGIPLEEQENIFERYYRGENKRLDLRGMGLGLSLSRLLATAMGGSLDLAESSPQGTRFRLLLPRWKQT